MRDVSLALPPQVHIDAGIGAAAQLLSAGVKVVIDIFVIEKQNQLGGVWRENTRAAASTEDPRAALAHWHAAGEAPPFMSLNWGPKPGAFWKAVSHVQFHYSPYAENTRIGPAPGRRNLAAFNGPQGPTPGP